MLTSAAVLAVVVALAGSRVLSKPSSLPMGVRRGQEDV